MRIASAVTKEKRKGNRETSTNPASETPRYTHITPTIPSVIAAHDARK